MFAPDYTHEKMRPDVCIYHGGCPDGFTAAWAIRKAWPEVKFIPAIYGEEPPLDEIKGKHVLLVDFSYKKPVLEAIAGKVARTVTVVDHHKSAEADLAEHCCRLSNLDDFASFCFDWGEEPIQAHFDMSRSGAMLAWNYAFPALPAPCLVEYVQDRDLWTWKLPSARELTSYISSFSFSFENWDRLAEELDNLDKLGAVISAGEAINRNHMKTISDVLAATQRQMMIGGLLVPVANLPYHMASDAANRMAKGQPFAATYFDDADGNRVFSLRSSEDGLDVSEIAVSYGGGGHKHASGFRVPLGWEGDENVDI
jgi:oligoribonuclease NrnB/cAMP/cGMP phosphodiesterase (DHH superfamily)